MKSATDTARRIREGEVSAEEVVRTRIARMDVANGEVNAVITRLDSQALARARELDERAAEGDWAGPLHGVPITVKDMFATEGVRTTYGMPNLIRHVPEHDAKVVRALIDAGAVLLGKTNLPFGSYDWQSVHPIYGRCSNPWNIDRTAGGSSGGSAASLAAGFADLEVGSDAAGSIRVPAHYCGVAGLRPTEGMLSNHGHGDMPLAREPLRSFSVVGPMARTVEDLELAWAVMRGEASDEPESDVAIEDLRIAWSTEQGGIPPTRAMTRVMAELRRKLEEAGADVVDARPDVDAWEAMHLWGRINGYELRRSFPGIATLPGISRVSEWVWFRQRLGPGEYVDATRAGFRDDEPTYRDHLEQRARIIEKADAFFADFDAWVLPGMPFAAFEHRPSGVAIPVDDNRENYADSHGVYQCPSVVMDLPVLALPVALNDGGLPLGVQIAGRRGDDRRILRIGRAVERVRGDLTYPSD